MMVHPQHHGAGVAASLMAEGLSWLGPANPIWLNVIRHNTRAIRFYERYGFRIDPDAATPHLVPHWIMRRPPSVPSEPRPTATCDRAVSRQPLRLPPKPSGGAT